MKSENQVTRRRFIRDVVATGSLIGLGGCCTPQRLPMPKYDKNTLFIEPHCHIFNGRDLDIYNYVAGDLPPGVDIVLGPVLYEVTEMLRRTAPTTGEELSRLSGWLADRESWLKSVNRPAEDKQANEQFDREVRNRVAGLKEEINAKRHTLMSLPELKKGIRAIRLHQKTDSSDALIDALAAQVFHAMNHPAVWAFLEGFWHYRIVNAQRLADTYPMIQLFTPAMMDTDSWFQHRPLHPSDSSEPLAPQAEIYEKVAILTNGRFLPFLAFDPRRQVEWTSGLPEQPLSPLALVEHCLARRCFVGLKLYPPMGYRPANNRTRDAKPNKDWWRGLGEGIDAAFQALFEKCVVKDLPLMAHTNHSHASDKDYLENGSPANWELALKEHPKLKINLAHFGGIKNKAGWREGICDLMKTYPGVFTDTGDFIEVRCQTEREAFFKAVEQLATTSPILDRLMYGSDFFMNGLSDGYDTYANDWIYSLQQHLSDDWGKVVGGNAADYLGLRSGPQRKRLDQFITTNHLSPSWVKCLA